MIVTCFHCDEPISSKDQISPTAIITAEGPRQTHVECAVRSVLGGIGHLTNHAFWCKQMHEPDALLTYRSSAQLVMQWVKTHSLEEAAAVDDS